MTYQPHTWTKGETITAQLLQNMDNGVAAAIDALESAFGSNYTVGSKEYKVDFTNLGTDKTISAGAITGTTLTASSDLTVEGTSNLKGKLTVGAQDISGGTDTELWGKLTINGREQTDSNNNIIKPAAILDGTLTVSGATTLEDILEVTKKATLNDELEVAKKATLKGTLSVTGNSTIGGNLTVGSARDRATIKLNDAVTINFSDNKNQVAINGRTQVNGQFYIGDKDNNNAAYIYGPLKITDYDSSANSSKTVIGLAQNGRITAKALTVQTGNNSLGGITTIDKLSKLIVGDSTTTVENEIYGFTTISDLTAGDLTVGTPTVESDSETQTYSGTATFNTSEIIFNQPASFFNNNVKTEHIEITSRSIKQSIGDQTYDLILQNGTDIYFGASNNNTFIRGSSVTIVENDLKFTMHNSTDTYTYCFADNGQAGFKLTANYDSSDSSPQPNHTLFHYIPSAFDDDMLIVGGLSNSVASTDTSLVQDVFINAKDSIILTTKNMTGIRINNNTTIAGTLKVQKIQTTVYDNSTTDGKQGYKYNYTLSASSTLGILNLLCEGVDNSNQSLTKSPVLFSYRPYGFESESYLTIGGPSLTPSNGDNKCVENMYIKAKENITLSPTSSTGKVTVNSDLHIDGKKSLYMRNTVLSEIDIVHLHTLWNNYYTQNGGE